MITYPLTNIFMLFDIRDDPSLIEFPFIGPKNGGAIVQVFGLISYASARMRSEVDLISLMVGFQSSGW